MMRHHSTSSRLMPERLQWVGSGRSGSKLEAQERPIAVRRSPKMTRAQKLYIVAILGMAGIGLAACSTLVSRHPVGNPSVPPPLKSVDVQKYLGRWYEVARYEQSFQKGCESVTADYALQDDGSIAVLNRCRKPGGKLSEARGRAKVADQTTNAKLKVSFFGPFYGDYWVLDHGDDYDWSIVGEGSGRYLWILSRQAEPTEAVIRKLIDRARALGYDTSLLRRTKQP